MKVVIIGIGPLGRKIFQFIQQRPKIKVVGAVDKNPELIGKDLGEVCDGEKNKIKIAGSLADALKKSKPDVAILTTVSDMKRATPQIEEILSFGLPIVSTCEELSFPWHTFPTLASRIDKAAKKAGVAVLGTGVNPGFLMDTLPTMLTAVCQDVQFVEVKRFQDAQFRRIPFQQKIGAGLSLEAFEKKKQDGSLRHVGLTESMHFIAHRMGWKLDKTEDQITPVVALKKIETPAMTIQKGDATGVRQIGSGYENSILRVRMVFEATVGFGESYDEVSIQGNPNLTSRIQGGVNGDIATCAIVLNAIPQVLRAAPGLKTMADVPIVSWF